MKSLFYSKTEIGSGRNKSSTNRGRGNNWLLIVELILGLKLQKTKLLLRQLQPKLTVLCKLDQANQMICIISTIIVFSNQPLHTVCQASFQLNFPQ